MLSVPLNKTMLASVALALSIVACTSLAEEMGSASGLSPGAPAAEDAAAPPSTDLGDSDDSESTNVQDASKPQGSGRKKPDASAPDASKPDASASDASKPEPSQPSSPSASALRGTNLVGMEIDYSFNASSGPVPDVEYAVHSTKIVDYLLSRKMNVLRFLFSWEGMQSTLGGPIPAASAGNYKSYYDDYKRIVDYATSKGMTVVVSPWQANSSGGAGGVRWRGNLVGGGTVTSAHFADFWSKMATIYADNPRVSIGLVNEPNGMSTMSWFSIAQDAIQAIRKTGFAGDIYVPGNGWTGAASWTESWYDTASTKRSNAYGWLNARGTGQPLLDPLGKLVVEVHSYADSDASGSSPTVTSTTTSRTRVKVAVDWARANGLKVWVGEIGMYANATNASANWNDFVSYLDQNSDTAVGFAWWACGKPGWWNDVAANGGGHYSITPTGDYATDTVNMTMIKSAFGN